MCLNEDASVRPFISDVVTALTFLGDGADTIELIDSPTEPSPSQSLSYRDTQNKACVSEHREREVAEAKEWGTNARTNATSKSTH